MYTLGWNCVQIQELNYDFEIRIVHRCKKKRH